MDGMADEDPFELFRQTVKQFNPNRTPFDPSEFGALGWPMTPLPATGFAGNNNVFSPEAGTKRAVTQLYSAIEELEDAPLGTEAAPTDVWEKYLEMFSMEGFTPKDAPERFGTMLLGTYQVWLYSLSQLLVESYTMQLVSQELVIEAHENSLRTQEWLWELSQPDREQLLMRCTDIDDELVEEMTDVRTRRNELLYNLGSWDRVALEDPVGDARRYLQVLTELDALVNDEHAFSYLPSGEDADGGDASETAEGTEEDDLSTDEDGPEADDSPADSTETEVTGNGETGEEE